MMGVVFDNDDGTQQYTSVGMWILTFFENEHIAIIAMSSNF